VAAARSKSQAKSTNDEPKRGGSDAEEAADKKKSRSTSRGVFDKLKGKKDEVEAKREEKKEEKQEAKEEKKIEKEEAKAEKEGEAAPAAAVAGGAAALDAPSVGKFIPGNAPLDIADFFQLTVLLVHQSRRASQRLPLSLLLPLKLRPHQRPLQSRRRRSVARSSAVCNPAGVA
jgi:hypothetical protein